MKSQNKKTEEAKAVTPAVSKKLFKVLDNIKHDGKLYKAGDNIDLYGIPKTKIEQMKRDGFIE